MAIPYLDLHPECSQVRAMRWGITIRSSLSYRITNIKIKQRAEVMFMSTPTYERQILSRVFRIGGTRPPVYNNLDKLIDALEADPSTLSYMSRKDAQATPDIKIIGNVGENRD